MGLSWTEAQGVATALLALYGGFYFIRNVFVGIWDWFRDRREKRLRKQYPELCERLRRDRWWMLEKEYRFSFSSLFVFLLREEMDRRAGKRFDFEIGAGAWEVRELDGEEFPDWTSQQMDIITGLVESFVAVGRKGVNEAFLSSSGRQEIARSVDRLGKIYERAIHLGIRYQGVRVTSGDGDISSDDLQGIVDDFPMAVHPVIQAIEDLVDQVESEMERHIEESSRRLWVLAHLLPEKLHYRAVGLAEEWGVIDKQPPEEVEIEVEVPADSIEELGEKMASLG